MDVEFDAPSRRRHTEVEVDEPPAGKDGDLSDHRNATTLQRGEQPHFGIGVLGPPRTHRTERADHRAAAGTASVSQSLLDVAELIAGDQSERHHLLDHAAMIERREMRRKIEGQPRPRRHDDPVGSELAILR